MRPNDNNPGNFRLFKTAGLVLAMLVLAQLAASAAIINFANPVAVSGNTDIFTLGQPVYAYSWGTAQTVNGTAFTATTSTNTVGGGNIILGNFNATAAALFAGTNAPYTNLTAAYKGLLSGGVYFTSGPNGTTGTVTVANLAVGHNYALQMWVNDSRGTFSNRNEYIYDGSGGTTNLLVYDVARTNGGLGQFIVGNFTADNSGSQNFTLDSGPTNNLPQLNSIQVRDLSSVWSGTTSGNWADSDSTSANFTGLSYQSVLGLGLTNVYFGDTDGKGNAVATSTVTVGAGGASSMNVVFLNRAVPYTLNSADANGISGGVNVTLSGTNNVVFTGAHSYTGNTVLGSNARLAIGPSGSIAGSTNVSLGAGSSLIVSNSSALSGAVTISLGAGSVLDASSSSLLLGASQILSGSGTVNGNVTAASGATLTPGSTGGPGALTFNNNLTLNGQPLVFDVGYGPNSAGDKIVVAGTLTLNGNSVISLNYLGGALYGGTYTLMNFGSISGGTISLDQSYPGVTLNVNATSVTLTVAGVTGGTSSAWTNLTGGNWTTAANWQGGIIASNVDALADFSTLQMTANTTVTVASTNITIGHMAFGDVGRAFNWTLTGGTNTLAVSSGSPRIAVNSGTATISSVLMGSQGFSKIGPGTLTLGGANKITNGVNVLGGTVNITSVGALGGTTVSPVNPVTFSNAVVQFTTSGAQYYTNDVYLLGSSNAIVQSSSAQDSFVGKITGSGILRVSAPGGVVIGQRGDMSGFTGTVLVTGSAAGNNAAGLLLGNGDSTGISGSSNAVFDYEGGTLNYLYSGSPTATNYLGALVGNNTSAILQAKNGTGSTTGDLTVEVGALNTDTTFAGSFRDYANVNTGTAPPKLGIRKVGTGALTLAGNNINTGPTDVRGGRLILSGGFAAPITVNSGGICEIDSSISSSTITANSGGTLLVGYGAYLGSAVVTANGLMDVSPWSGSFSLNTVSLTGSGLVNGSVILSGSSYLNPGTIGDAGTLTITNGDLVTQGGVMEFDLSTTNAPASGNDLLTVYGNMDFTAGATISISRIQGYIGGGTYVLAQCSGSVLGSVDNLTLVGANAQDYLQIDGTNLELVVFPTTLLSWTGDGAGNLWDINGSANWLAALTSSVFTNGCGVSFDISGITNPIVNIPATVTPSVVLLSGSTNYTFVGAGDITGSAALVKNGSNTLTILNTNTFTGAVYLKGGTLAVGNASANGQLAANLRTSSGASLVWTTPLDQLMTNVISGPATMIKQGPGTLTLTRTNTLSGATTISAGTLALGDGFSANGLLGAGNLTNNGLVLLMEPNPATLSNNIAGSGGIDNSSSASVILAGAISGTGKLTNDYSAGALYLTANNTYSGGTVINNGTVVVSDPTLHGLGSGSVVINDGTGAIWFSGSGSNVVANNIQLPSSTTADQFLLPGATTVRLTGLLTGGAAGQITRFVNLSAGGDNRGVIILDNPANTFTTIPETYFGTLAFTSDGALGNPTNSISVNVGNKPNTQFYSLVNDGLSFASNNITLNASRSINLVGAENINVQTYNGTINGPITGNSLTKLGTGTLTLNGTGSLTNSTTVSAGTLVLNSVWTGTNVSVSSGATLSGSGIIDANVQIANGGTLAPGGASTAVLTVNSNLLLNASSIAHMNVNAGTVASDRVTCLGTVTYAGSLAVTNIGGTFVNGQSFQLFSAANYAGNFTATNLPALGSGLAWNWNPALGTLSVVTGGPTVATNSTNITATVSGGNLNLSWPSDHTGWRLLVQTNSLTGTNWVTWPNSTNVNSVVIPIDPSNKALYFEMVYP